MNKDEAEREKRKNWEQAEEWKEGAELLPEIAAIFREEGEEVRQHLETEQEEENAETLGLAVHFYERHAQSLEDLATICETIRHKTTENKAQEKQKAKNSKDKEEGAAFVECSQCAEFKQLGAWGFCHNCGAYLVSGRVWAITHGIPSKEEEAQKWREAQKLQTGAELLQKIAAKFKEKSPQNLKTYGPKMAEKLQDLADICQKMKKGTESKAHAMQKARHLSNKEKKQAEEFRQIQNLQNKKTKAKS